MEDEDDFADYLMFHMRLHLDGEVNLYIIHFRSTEK